MGMRVVAVSSSSSSASSSAASVPARARGGRQRALGRRVGRRGASTRARALPPANEIAGFVVGAALVGLCFGGATLDGVIARAQAAGMEGEGARGTKASATTRRGKGSGNVFVVPDDDEGGDGGGGGA